jgi:signal transduction histidine kinase
MSIYKEDSTPIPPIILQQAFPGMKEVEAKRMILNGQVKQYPAGVTLCHEGVIETIFYIIINGEVKVTKLINETQNRLLKILGKGDFFGEMAIIHEAPRGATCTTTTDTLVLEIEKETFKHILETSSSMSLAMVREVSRRLRENDEMAIDDLRHKANELAEAYQQLAEMDAARSGFLATIAHELRTPLMAASGFVRMIQAGRLTGKALESTLDVISRNMQEIISLTNDILFLQEMDLIMPEFQPTDIGGVVASSLEKQRQNATRNLVGLSFNIAPDLPKILGAPKSLERAFTAILDNAIKFSPDGGEVVVEVKPVDDNINVRIKDQGVGIAPEVLPRIFDRFFHADRVGDHLFRGAGLGLSIARHVIEQHKGSIQVESELSKGSTFTVFLKKI